MEGIKKFDVDTFNKEMISHMARITGTQGCININGKGLDEEIEAFIGNKNADHAEAVHLLKKTSFILDKYSKLVKEYWKLAEFYDEYIQSLDYIINRH